MEVIGTKSCLATSHGQDGKPVQISCSQLASRVHRKCKRKLPKFRHVATTRSVEVRFGGTPARRASVLGGKRISEQRKVVRWPHDVARAACCTVGFQEWANAGAHRSISSSGFVGGYFSRHLNFQLGGV